MANDKHPCDACNVPVTDEEYEDAHAFGHPAPFPEDERDHGKMRRIASEWHGGMATAMYAFVSTGTILPGLLREVEGDIANFVVLGEDDEVTADELAELRDYVADVGEREAQAGWSEIWS